jgi:hypothetical protein
MDMVVEEEKERREKGKKHVRYLGRRINKDLASN